MKELYVELRAGEDSVLTPDGAFKIDPRDRPKEAGKYRVFYEPLEQFIACLEPGWDKKFESILKLAADTPEQLRRCDVIRVIDAAANAGCLHGFAQWLRRLRPNLGEEIKECIFTIQSFPED